MAQEVLLTEQQRSVVPEVVERYLAGESLQDVAADLSERMRRRVDRRALYDWMFTELGGVEYTGLVTRCLVARVADADEALEAATDPVLVAKARETCRFARMDLERRRPALYGAKQEVKHTGAAPSFTVVLLDRASGGGQVQEGTVVPSVAEVVKVERAA